MNGWSIAFIVLVSCGFCICASTFAILCVIIEMMTCIGCVVAVRRMYDHAKVKYYGSETNTEFTDV